MEETDKESTSADFANLPELPLLDIFSYLRTDDLCRARRVCSRWYEISKFPSLWKSVDVHHLQLSSWKLGELFRTLPRATKRLRIYRFPPDVHISKSTDLPPFHLLDIRCPDLHIVILECVVLNEIRLTMEHGLPYLPRQLTVLSVRRCDFRPTRSFFAKIRVQSCHGIFPEIRVFDGTECKFFTDESLSHFRTFRRPLLEELYLAGCSISEIGIRNIAPAISNLKVLDLEKTDLSIGLFYTLSGSCKRLEQLFIAKTRVTDEELRAIQKGWLPKLKEICLKRTMTSWNCKRSLFSLFPSLEHVGGFSFVSTETSPNDNDICDHFVLRQKYFNI